MMYTCIQNTHKLIQYTEMETIAQKHIKFELELALYGLNVSHTYPSKRTS